MNDDEAYGGRDYNSNPSLLSSILAKLSSLDDILDGLRRLMDETKTNTDKIASARNDMSSWLTSTMNNIQTELNAKLHTVLDKLRQHQLNQRAEGLKLQQEISHLKKEKLQLYQQITDIQKRIADTENIIGYDNKV